MQDERWEQLKTSLKRNFSVEEEGQDDILGSSADGPVKQGEVEFLVVKTPLGKIKVTRESRPLVLEKKLHYSHRQGASATSEYKFSDTEKTHKLRVYKSNDLDDDWSEIDTGSLGGMV